MSETELYGIKPKIGRKGPLQPMTILINTEDVRRMRQHFPEFNASFFFRTQLARTLVDLDEKTAAAKVKKKNGKA